jgi:dTDP-4-dehydrorhamnose 3,5-epimerase
MARCYTSRVRIRELSIPDAYEITPVQRADDRGLFLEWYRFDSLAEVVGHPLDLRQANLSVSARGVVRGIHFADVPRGQAKYVTVAHGAVRDYVNDNRVGSPTFGQWDVVELDDRDRKAIYIAEGLGHCFVAVTNDAVVSYLVSDVYQPTAEHGITPTDPEIGLPLPDDPRLSPKDVEAPSLAEARERGLLPEWDAMRSYYDSLAGGAR